MVVPGPADRAVYEGPRPLQHVVGLDDQGQPLLREDPPWCASTGDCLGDVKKGVAWRSVHTIFEGPRTDAEALVRKFAAHRGTELDRGAASGIERAPTIFAVPTATRAPRRTW